MPFTIRDYNNLKPLLYDPAKAARYRKQIEEGGGDVATFDADLEAAASYGLNRVEAAKYKLEYGTLQAAPERKAEAVKGVGEIKAQAASAIPVKEKVKEDIPQNAPGAPPPRTVEREVTKLKPVSELVAEDVQGTSERWKEAINWDKFVADPSLDILDVGRAVTETFQRAPGKQAIINAYKNEPAKQKELLTAYDIEAKRQRAEAEKRIGKGPIEQAKIVFAQKSRANQAARNIKEGRGTPEDERVLAEWNQASDEAMGLINSLGMWGLLAATTVAGAKQAAAPFKWNKALSQAKAGQIRNMMEMSGYKSTQEVDVKTGKPTTVWVGPRGEKVYETPGGGFRSAESGEVITPKPEAAVQPTQRALPGPKQPTVQPKPTPQPKVPPPPTPSIKAGEAPVITPQDRQALLNDFFYLRKMPYEQVIERIGEQGYKGMVQAGVLQLEGKDVTLTPNGRNLAKQASRAFQGVPTTRAGIEKREAAQAQAAEDVKTEKRIEQSELLADNRTREQRARELIDRARIAAKQPEVAPPPIPSIKAGEPIVKGEVKEVIPTKTGELKEYVVKPAGEAVSPPFTGKLAAAPEVVKPEKVKRAVTWFQEKVGGNAPQKINDAVDAAIAAKGVQISHALRVKLQDKAMYLVHDYAYRHSSKAKGMQFPEQHLYEAAKQVVDREWAKDVEPWLGKKKAQAEGRARREAVQTPLLAKVRAEGGLPPMLEKSTGMPLEWEEYVISTPPQARPAPWNKANESNMWEKDGKTPSRRFWAKPGTQTVPEEVANTLGFETMDELRQALALESRRGISEVSPPPTPSIKEGEPTAGQVQILDMMESESGLDVFATIPPELEGKFNLKAEAQILDKAVAEFRNAFKDPANAEWLASEGFTDEIRDNILKVNPKFNLQIVGDAKLAGRGQWTKGGPIEMSWLPYTLGVPQPEQMSRDNIAVLLHEFGHAAGADEVFDQSTAAIAAKIHMGAGNQLNPEAVNSQVNFFKDRAANAPTEVERMRAQANLAYLGEEALVKETAQVESAGYSLQAEVQRFKTADEFVKQGIKPFHAVKLDDLELIAKNNNKIVAPSFGMGKSVDRINEYGEVVFGVPETILEQTPIFTRDIWSVTMKNVPERLFIPNPDKKIFNVVSRYVKDIGQTLKELVHDSLLHTEPARHIHMVLTSDYNFYNNQPKIAEELGIPWNQEAYDNDELDITQIVADGLVKEIPKTPENISKYLTIAYGKKAKGVGSMFKGSQVSAKQIKLSEVDKVRDLIIEEYDKGDKIGSQLFQGQMQARQEVQELLGLKPRDEFETHLNDEMGGELAAAPTLAKFRKVLEEWGVDPRKYSNNTLKEAQRILQEAYLNIPTEYLEAKSMKVFDINDFPYVVSNNSQAITKLKEMEYTGHIYKDYEELYNDLTRQARVQPGTEEESLARRAATEDAAKLEAQGQGTMFNVRGSQQWLSQGPVSKMTAIRKFFSETGDVIRVQISSDADDLKDMIKEVTLWNQDTKNKSLWVHIDVNNAGEFNRTLGEYKANSQFFAPFAQKIVDLGLGKHAFLTQGDELDIVQPGDMDPGTFLSKLAELHNYLATFEANGKRSGITAGVANSPSEAIAILDQLKAQGLKGMWLSKPGTESHLDTPEEITTLIFNKGKPHGYDVIQRPSGYPEGETASQGQGAPAYSPGEAERGLREGSATAGIPGQRIEGRQPEYREGASQPGAGSRTNLTPVTPPATQPLTPPTTVTPPTTEQQDRAIGRYEAYLRAGNQDDINRLVALTNHYQQELGETYPVAAFHAVENMSAGQGPRQVTPAELPYIESSLDADERKKFEAVKAELYDAGMSVEDAYNEALRQVADIEIVETVPEAKPATVKTAKPAKPKPTPKPDELAKLHKYNATKVERTYTKPTGDVSHHMIGEYTLPDGFRLTGWGNGDWSVSGKPAGKQSRHPSLDLALASVGDSRQYLARREQFIARAEDWKVPRKTGEPVSFGKDRAYRFARYLTGKKLISDLTMEDMDKALEYVAFIPPEIGDITHLAAWTGALEMVKTDTAIPEIMALADSWNLVQGEESPRDVGVKLLDHIRANAQNPWLMPPKGMPTEEYILRIQEGTLQEPLYAGKQVGMERLITPAQRILESIGAGKLFYDALASHADLFHWMDDAMGDFRTMGRDLIKAVGRKPAKEFIKKGQAFDILNGQTSVAGLAAPYVKYVDSIKALIERVQVKVDEVRALEGLPPLEKLPNYIYHQFEQVTQDMLRQKYPFDESMSYLLQKKVIPVTTVRDVTQLHRINREGGLVKDLERLIPALAQSKLKYAALQPVVTEIRNILRDKTNLIPAQNRVFIETWLENNVLGNRKSKLDNDLAQWAAKANHIGDFVAKVFEKIPGFRAEAPRIRANFPKWVTDFVTKGNYAAGLGLNLQTAVLNIFQQVHNIGINGPAGFLSGLTALFDPWALKMNKEFNPSYAGRQPAELYQETPYGFDLWGTVYKVSTIPYAKADEWNIISAASGAVRQLLPRYPELYARVKAKMGEKQTYWKAVYETMAEDPEAFKELWARASHRVGVSQYFYNQLAQAQVSHNFIGRLAWVYKTWMQNYFLNFIPEMVQIFTTGKDSMGNPVSRGERYGLLWYLLAAAAINYVFKKAKLDISRAFGLKVFSRQPSPILNMLDKLGALVEATQGDSDYRKMTASREFQNALKIFVPFRQFGRVFDVLSGKEPRWWTIIVRDVRPLPKPDELKRFDKLNPERAQGFLYTLDEQKRQVFVKYMQDVLEGKNGQWSRAQRIEAGNLGLALEDYLIENEKQAKRDAVERMRASDLPGAALVLERAGYRGADLKAELDALILRYMNRAMRESTETGRVLNALTSPEFEEAAEIDPTGLLDIMGAIVSFVDKASSIKLPKGTKLEVRQAQFLEQGMIQPGAQLSPDARNLLPLISDPARAASIRAKLEAEGGNVEEFDKDLEEARNYQLQSQGGSQ